MIGRRKLHPGDATGTSLIEFALVLPVFVFLMMGIVEVSRYTYFGIVAAHAARAGVQYASQTTETAADANTNGPATKSAALADGQNLSNWTITSSLVCTVNGQASTCPMNTANAVPANLVYYVQVKVTGRFNTLMNYPGIPTNIPITSTAIMPVGNQ
jgi:Flp pilus assembly protein TadG